MITQTLNDIVRLLTKSKIGYMVMGAQAVIVYGKPRLTQDIDITVALSIDEANKLLNAVAASFIALPKDTRKFISQTWVLPLEHRITNVRVDIIFSITPFERKAIKEAKKVVIEDTPIRFIAPEYLVIQKVIAGRSKDLEDASGILKVQGSKIKLASIEKLLKELAKTEGGDEWLWRWRKLKQDLE